LWRKTSDADNNNNDGLDARAGVRVRDPNARAQYQVRLPKKLRKRKWKIGAIKNFINKHLFGYAKITTDSEEVTSSRAAEKYASKSPSTKDYRKVNHQAQKDDDDHDDDDDDDQDKKKNNDDDDDGKAKTLSSWRKREKSKEKKQNGKTNEQRRSSLGEPSDEQISERLLKYSYEPSWFLKIAWALEQFSLSASDLNVVLFFFSLPWLRQFWR